ncbi:hypothetical protein DFH07DRAFT_847587 [Mycena maculata]|uniref:Uncharacterized protein n=1 Tax=Mycena maculata TaxID=230809 RepID=A0AAD7HYK7_9AGAR|nr:hypothetical protein DFH07DRAFT_847587 [Mycena maculata]
MTPKRTLEGRSSSSEPPKKRRHTTSGTSSSPFRHPYISSTPYPFCPSDSPSNPFGRTRTWNLLQALPPATSFSKHLPLRFQYLKRDAPRETLDGIYRVVQVPQSYTLVHLKSLLGFLFGGAYGQIPPSAEEEEEGPAYIFEIKKRMALYSSLYKPGQIKYGSTWAYSSSILDPYLYYPDWDTDDDPGEEARDSTPPMEEPVEDERKWTAEEDLTIAHVWPEGGDMTRGIIYQHSPDLQIHITINTMPITSRRGKGNLPHVFRACGLVYLDEPDEEDGLEDEDPTALLDPSNWNEPEKAFAKYYGRHTLLPFAGYHKEAASSSPSLPSLTFSSSPVRTSSSSSPSLATSSSSRVSPMRIFGSSPGHFPKYTPAPRPAQRKRIRHLQDRLGALTREGAKPYSYRPKRKPAKEAYEDRERRACSEEL